MKELGQFLFEPFCEHPGNLLKVSRIYRDARLHHPLPYKEGLWICIRQEADWWAENPCLFFEIFPEGVNYGFCLWRPKVSTLEDIRKDITARPTAFLELIHSTQQETGIPVTAELYKRPKEAPSEELAPYFAWKGNISCIVHEDVSEAMFGPELGQRAQTLFRQLMPLYNYFNRFKA